MIGPTASLSKANSLSPLHLWTSEKGRHVLHPTDETAERPRKFWYDPGDTQWSDSRLAKN